MALPRFGRYEALRRIASGGMASVYLGRAVGAGGFERLVAIKVMHDHIADEPAFSGMFLDEARLAARIRHPNVVPTLDVADDGRFIVMEYVEGASLQAILEHRRARGDGSLPVGIALRIFLDALAGLHAAHELCDAQGKLLRLVHRDVSPHNVLVGVDGLSRITDFGIAYAEARITSTRSGQLKGKLPYMAPEQLEDAKVTRRTDVYAAGCVLFEMLAGRRLFRGGNEAAVACAVLAGPEMRLLDVRPSVPPALDRACMHALRSHDERFESAQAFADALEAAAEEAGIAIAKHRDIGSVAVLPQMTFPPASTLTEESVDPRPVALAVASAATTVAMEEPAPVDASVTSPGAGISADISLPSGARTTTEDRPPPEVAAVLRAALEEDQAARTGPITEVGVTSHATIPTRSRASFIAAAVVAVLVGAGIVVLNLREDRPDPSRHDAAPGEPARPGADSISAGSTSASTSGELPSASSSAIVHTQIEAPVPTAPVSGGAKLPALAFPKVSASIARPAAPVPPPPATGGEYHPDNP